MVVVRCAWCNERRPGMTASAFLELEYGVPPARPDGPVVNEEREPRWWAKRIDHRSALSAYRAGAAPGSPGQQELLGRIDPGAFLALTGVSDPAMKTLYVGPQTVPSREQAIRSRINPKGVAPTAFGHAVEDISLSSKPARGIQLGPCRGAHFRGLECRNRPRLKWRTLYARAEAAAIAGRDCIYV